MNVFSYINNTIKITAMNNEQENLIIIKALCNPHRLAIISLLSKIKKDFCVNEIAKGVNISQSLASHQLAYLEARGVVDSKRMGQSICYMITASPRSNKLIKIIKLLN